MFANVTGWHFLIIALVILLLFGATRLPALAKSVGQSAKIFRKEIKEGTASDASDDAADEALVTTATTADSAGSER